MTQTRKWHGLSDGLVRRTVNPKNWPLRAARLLWGTALGYSLVLISEKQSGVLTAAHCQICLGVMFFAFFSFGSALSWWPRDSTSVSLMPFLQAQWLTLTTQPQLQRGSSLWNTCQNFNKTLLLILDWVCCCNRGDSTWDALDPEISLIRFVASSLHRWMFVKARVWTILFLLTMS